ncbi:unnamed protein product [Penicillium nalgiovense]|nr:unnamed protein product [Penicillium nalgiovense]
MGETQLRRLATEPHGPNYIPSLQQTTPQILWIGCSDGNFKECTMLNILDDELLVLTNIGNMIIDGDLSCDITIENAVVDLQVKHIVVCGHCGCRIVKATARNGLKGLWLSKLNALHLAHEDINQLPVSERDRAFVELNIFDQMHSLRRLPEVANAIALGRLRINGIVYDLETEKAYRLSEGQPNP